MDIVPDIQDIVPGGRPVKGVILFYQNQTLHFMTTSIIFNGRFLSLLLLIAGILILDCSKESWGTRENGSSQQLLVVDQGAGTLSFYEPESGLLLGKAKVGYNPHEVVISRDGKTAYITNFGIEDYDHTIGVPGVRFEAGLFPVPVNPVVVDQVTLAHEPGAVAVLLEDPGQVPAIRFQFSDVFHLGLVARRVLTHETFPAAPPRVAARQEAVA